MSIERKELNFGLINEAPQISQFFYSLEGEGYHIGRPSLYVRLAGCYSAACRFCDTKFSWFNNSRNIELKDLKINIIDYFNKGEKKIDNLKSINKFTLTGGEPLHFMQYFKEIATIIKDIAPNLEIFSIESNGNLLQDQEILEKFNEVKTQIFNELNLDVMLTISPKLNSATCYQNMLTQDEITEMYTKVIDNVSTLLSEKERKLIISYKFIWNVSEIDNKVVNYFITYLLNSKNISSDNIFLMPFTPNDINSEEWEESKKITAKKALMLGIRYSPRLHIDLGLD